MTQSDLTQWLRNHGACVESLTWLDAHADLTPQELWESCPRGDWLAWALEAAGLDVPASAYRALDEVCGAADRALYEACASARRAYYEVCDSAGRALDEACASASRALDEACASASRAYDEARAAADRAYDEAIYSARRELAVAIRAKVSFDDVLKGCGA
jgi:thioesterase domain-containing protein